MLKLREKRKTYSIEILRNKKPNSTYIYSILSDSVEIHEDQENDNLLAVNLDTGPPIQRSSIVFDIDENDYLVSNVK